MKYNYIKPENQEIMLPADCILCESSLIDAGTGAYTQDELFQD